MISCGFFSRSSSKQSSSLFSMFVESTLMEASLLEEAIAKKSIDANTFHHTMENNIRIKHERYNMKSSHRSTAIIKSRFSSSKNNSQRHSLAYIRWTLSLVVVYMVDTLSRVFQLSVMVELGEPLVRYQDIT